MADLTNEVVSKIAELVRASTVVQYPQGQGALPFVVVPNHCKVEDLSHLVYNEHNERPERKKGTVKVLDADSFCEYYKLFSDPNSRAFADETAAKILAVLDYHETGSAPARWGSHRVDLTLRHSEEWKRWKAKDGVKLPQMEFAEFIEDNTPDIIDPTAATMLEMARDLRAKTDVDFSSAIRTQDGSVDFKYSEQVKASFGAGSVSVPEAFKVSIPIHIGSGDVEITARMRYRINSGKLTFWYNLLRADVAEYKAFRDIRKKIAEALKITIINGSPA